MIIINVLMLLSCWSDFCGIIPDIAGINVSMWSIVELEGEIEASSLVPPCIFVFLVSTPTTLTLYHTRNLIPILMSCFKVLVSKFYCTALYDVEANCLTVSITS